MYLSFQKVSQAISRVSSVVTDAYFNLVTLLLNTTSTNGAQNNTFLDSSTNNFTITRNGNATQGTFTPFSQTGWGTYFTGSSTRLTYPGSSSTYVSGTGDFTIEMWINIDAASAGRSRVLIEGDVSNGIQMRLGPSNTNNINGLSVSRVFNADNEYCNYTFAFNTWYHVAVTRASAVYYFFVNGVQYTTQNVGQTGTYNFQVPTTVSIGDNLSFPNDEIYKGYISNIRVSNVGRYTSNFTPSTTPLTALSGTQFLSLQNNRWIDNSTNNSIISSNGTPSVQAFSPFAPTTAYSTSVVGGSGYFDGSGDYLSTSSNAAFAFGLSDFEVDFWIYATALPASDNNILNQNLSSGTPQFYIDSSGKLQYRNAFIGAVLTSNTTFKTGQWYYCVISRVSLTTRMFINGVLDTSGADANNWSNTAGWYISNNSGSFTGYISNVRLVNGSGITSSTVPTAPLTAITNTVLLTNFTNAGIYDSAAKNDLETVGDAQVSTTQAKWGTTSMKFDGSGDYLVAPQLPINSLGSGNFTIDGWFYCTGYNGGAAIYSGINTYPSSAGLLFYLNASGTYTVDVGGSNVIASGTAPLNTWTYFALVRSGSTITLYINGSSVSSGSNSTNFTSQYLTIGRTGAGTASNYYLGYLDDIRITNGYARTITASPTAAFPLQ
jgi:hypothetical protein